MFHGFSNVTSNEMKDILRGVVLTGIFIIPFLPLVVADSLFFPFITGKNFAFRIIVEIIFASWIVLAFLDRSYRPKFSWIMGAFIWFIGVMFVANLLGESPHKSMWSNYERMEGFVSIAHLLLLLCSSWIHSHDREAVARVSCNINWCRVSHVAVRIRTDGRYCADQSERYAY